MFCEKCGLEVINGKCVNCGFIQQVNLNNYNSQYTTNYNQADLANASIVKWLGIGSFVVPMLSFIALILGRGYNKKNNYGDSRDMKIGKICAKVVAWIYAVSCVVTIAIMIFASLAVGQMNKDMYIDASNALSEYENSITVDDDRYSEIIDETEESTSMIDYIGAEKAVLIALNDIGIKANEADDFACVMLESDGEKIYMVTIQENGKNYLYEINAVTGEISNLISTLLPKD